MQERVAERHRHIFSRPEQVARYLASIHLPASLTWSFLNNGKAGTSSARRFLFELEFGAPLTVHWNVRHDINPDSVVHYLQGETGVLRAAVALSTPFATLDAALRLTTVRHPLTRAVSAFEYLCKSNDLAHDWFAADRLRMNALLGFNWESDARSARGFSMFLDYIMWTGESLGNLAINPHWRPQIDNILPDLYRPDIVGRLEDMRAFYRATAVQLDRPLPADFDLPHSNRQEYLARTDWLSPEARRKIGKIYARDLDWLGYGPEEAG
ncbi:sulfotransferase family 2 domain-containing protein [Defluviimonas sp. SAOS-178_SWC]|uniref:sulfotransferase family 2 domain-containing protein n=1 Tax=Defluviimonas sp. SAOS-178_SWC TaxID=3121287 RepID=UPI00322165DD